MSESLSRWLALRQTADWAARSTRLTEAILGAVAARDPVQIVDLGTGTCSNVLYLSSRIPRRQRWLVVDRDPRLLAEVVERLSARPATSRRVSGGPDLSVETRQMDLGSLEDRTIFAGRHLVTASALLDLVSESWLRTLAARCREAGAAALFPLNYNGESSCDPREPEDEQVRELLNRHQHTDKGLGGPAAGPDAAARAVACFSEAGYQVETERTDWVLEPRDREFQEWLVTGWAQAAVDIAPGSKEIIRDWLTRRLSHIESGTSRIVVGHHDVAAWAP